MPLVEPVTMSTTATTASPKSSKAQSVSGKPTTTTTTTTTTESSSSQTHPVHVHATAASQAARHVFPVLLASLFYGTFGRLVAEPVATLWTALPVVALLQILYAFVCLPLAGSGGAGGAGKGRKQRPGEKKKDGAGPSFAITALIALLLSLLLTPLLHATMILFGAPLLTHASHTFLCAAHLSILTSFPLFVVHGVDPTAWLSLAGFRAPFDECYGGLVGGFLGAWLGAVPIPLDWDREWQKWPVTILAGIYAGYVIGRVLGGTVLFGKRF